jgi:hypothetical protein
MTAKLVLIFRFFEPVFWLAQALIIVNLVKPRASFKLNVKVLNWLLGYQGFEPQIQPSDKAFKVWHRDLWILLFLNPLIIILIHFI